VSKMKCLSKASIHVLNLFTGKARSLHKWITLRCHILNKGSSASNIRLGYKWLNRTHTLDHFRKRGNYSLKVFNTVPVCCHKLLTRIKSSSNTPVSMRDRDLMDPSHRYWLKRARKFSSRFIASYF
jgi:hypothetical protein